MEENNEILKEIKSKIEMSESEESVHFTISSTMLLQTSLRICSCSLKAEVT